MRHRERRPGLRPLLLLGVLSLLIWGGLTTPAHAGRVITNGEIRIPTDEVIQDDLYLFGQRVIIAGRVEGDLYAVAQEVLITGEITGDVVVAAQVVTIQGYVGDDLRAAAAILRVKGATLGDDVLTAGMAVNVQPAMAVPGDVWAAGYQVYITDVDGNVWAAGNGVTIAGRVGGNVYAVVGDGEGPPVTLFTFFAPVDDLPYVPAGLTLTERARVRGDLVYRSFQAATLAADATVEGRIIQELPQPPDTDPEPEIRWGSRPWLIAQGRRWITLLLVGGLSFLAMPHIMRQLGRPISRRPLPALGWGLVIVLGVIGALMLLFLGGLLLTIVFGVLSLNTLATWSFLLSLGTSGAVVISYLAYTTLLAPSVVGYGLFSRWDRGGHGWVLPLGLGLSLYIGASSLPYIGGVIYLLVWLWGLGALWLFWRDTRRVRRAPPPTPESS